MVALSMATLLRQQPVEHWTNPPSTGRVGSGSICVADHKDLLAKMGEVAFEAIAGCRAAVA